MSTNKEDAPSRSLVTDMLWMVPGWLLLLAMDPLMATVVGIPTAGVLIVIARTVWERTPIRGRLVAAVLLPGMGMSATTAVVFGTGGTALGMILTLGLAAMVEAWARRSGRSFLSRFPLLAGGSFMLLSLVLSVLLISAEVTQCPTEECLKDLSAAPEAPEWSAEAKREAIRFADRILEERFDTHEEASVFCDDHCGDYKALSASPHPAGVFVIFYDNKGGSVRGHGRGGTSATRDLLVAVVDALQRAERQGEEGSKVSRPWSGKYLRTLIQVDVPGRSVAVRGRPLFLWFGEIFRGADESLEDLKRLPELLNAAVDMEPGVDGLEVLVEGQSEPVYMLPAEPITRGWLTPRRGTGPAKIAQMLRKNGLNEIGEHLGFDEEEIVLRKFRTRRFGEFRPDSEIRDFYRGNVLLKGDLTRELLLERLNMATNWLSRMMGEGGRFHYEMRPPYRQVTKNYNLPRHAGAAYGLLHMYNVSRGESGLESSGEKALAAGVSAMEYMKGSLRSPDPSGEPDLRCFISEKGVASSGSTGLGAIGLAALPARDEVEDPKLRKRVGALERNETLRSMCECLLQMIDADGAVHWNYEDATTMDRVEEEPLYYPGELALALVRAYKILGDDRYLEGSVRIADRQRRIFAPSLALDFPWPGDHWIIQALTELAEETDDLEYAELAVLMGEGYAREQYPPQAHLFPDYRGAYRRIVDVPRTTRAASRGEALTAALRAARLTGHDPARLERALVEGARHLIEQQFTRENDYFIPRSWDVKGAIRMGLVDNHLRIDNNQHAVVGMAGALEVLSR